MRDHEKARRVLLYTRLDVKQGYAASELEQVCMDRQTEMLREFAVDFGRTVAGEYHDFCSGHIYDRPGLSALLEAVRRGDADAVLLKSETRLGRSVFENLRMEQKVRDCGGRAFYADRIRCGRGNVLCGK